MALAVFLAFVAVPIAEIAVFIQVGGAIGLWATLLAVVATAIVGTWLMRMQGLGVLARAQASLARNALPVNELIDGLCLLFAGMLLLTPGFITDAAGILLLVPPVRTALRGALWRLFQRHGRTTAAWSRGGPGMPPTDEPPHARRDGVVIEGDYRELPADEPVETRRDDSDRGDRR